MAVKSSSLNADASRFLLTVRRMPQPIGGRAATTHGLHVGRVRELVPGHFCSANARGDQQATTTRRRYS